MRTIITVGKEDLLKLLNIALEKEQKRKAMNEICHFDLMLYPFPDMYDDTLYDLCIEYFTTSRDNDKDYAEEICKIDSQMIMCSASHEKEQPPIPIVIGLVGVSIEKIADYIGKINDEIIRLEIDPIEVDGMLSYSIVSIEDLFPVPA
jgi:hypothetical protein